ncbi:MAG: RDD family protein [Bacteroidota bacterium]
MEPYQSQPEEQHLFDDNKYHLVQASGGKRFLNYIIDRIVFYVLFYFLTLALALLNVNIVLTLNPDTASFVFFSLLLYVFLYALFMGLTEFALKGKTIGKFLTGTRAVKEDGSYLEIKDALLRGFCRIIPFNIFSALGNTCYPWHDSLPKTYVIDERESQFPM